MILVDSDILIQYARRDQLAADWLDKRSNSSRLAISVVTEMELVFGSRDKQHLNETQRFLSRFEVAQIDASVSVLASDLIKKYCLSHKLQIPDALIAATALEIGCSLATINRKDFRYIDGLELAAYPN